LLFTLFSSLSLTAVSGCTEAPSNQREDFSIRAGMSLDSVLMQIGEGPVRPATPQDEGQLFHGYRRYLLSAGDALFTLLLYRSTPSTTADSVRRADEEPILLIRDRVVVSGWRAYDSVAVLRGLPNLWPASSTPSVPSADTAR
jgi:hypothetical protein